jgi:hypothetical protein
LRRRKRSDEVRQHRLRAVRGPRCLPRVSFPCYNMASLVGA